MRNIFARYVACNIDSVDQHCLLCKMYKHFYNFRLTYPVSGLVLFRLEQISAVTDLVPEQLRPDCT